VIISNSVVQSNSVREGSQTPSFYGTSNFTTVFMKPRPETYHICATYFCKFFVNIILSLSMYVCMYIIGEGLIRPLHCDHP
jgi:hypothetical protein